MHLKNYPIKFVLLALLLLIGACVSQPQISVEALPNYDALFENTEGWTGADGAYTVPLSEKTTLWLFGDTWVGEIRNGMHVNAVIINNSVAIQKGLYLSDVSVDFTTGLTKGGEPQAFVRPADGRGWFWVYHGTRAQKGLYLFLMQIERTASKGTFGFKIIGTWLGHVVNPDDPPNSWRLSQQRIPWGEFSPSGDTIFGSALLKEQGYVYIYGTGEDVNGEVRRKYMILARVPENELEKFDQWRFFTGGGWTYDFKQAAPLCGEIANEYSVSFIPKIKKYVAVYTENGFSKNIVARFAPNPWGPWSDAIFLYECPEIKWGGDIFCYAAKGHPAISLGPDELLVTYVANSMDFERMAADAKLYRPRFLRVRFDP